MLGMRALEIIALVLRPWGIGFGLPEEYHIDEHLYHPHAWTMGQGQLQLPNLYLGLLLMAQKSMLLALFLQLSTAGFGALRDTNPWPYSPSAYIVRGLLGALTIPVLYLLTRRVRAQSRSLITAALMTALLFHVRDLHFDTVYRPATELWNLCYAGPDILIYRVR